MPEREEEGLSKAAPALSAVWKKDLLTRSGVVSLPYTNLSKSDFQFSHLTEAERFTAWLALSGCLELDSPEKALKLGAFSEATVARVARVSGKRLIELTMFFFSSMSLRFSLARDLTRA